MPFDFLLLTILFLFPHLLLFSMFLFISFTRVMMNRRVHIIWVVSTIGQNLTILCQWLLFFLGDFFIKSFSILFNWVFSILINWNFDYSLILYLFLSRMKIFKVRVSKSIFNSQSAFRIKNQHFLYEIECLVIHLWEERSKWSFLDITNLVDTFLSHNRLNWIDFITIRLT